MGIEQKIFRFEVLGRLIKGDVIKKDRAQDRALGLDIGRKALGRDVLSGRQLKHHPFGSKNRV
jgi:hypothetical protein